MKHCRDVIKQLKEELPGVEITRLRQKKHLIYELKLGVTVRHLAVSVSPKNYDHTVLNAVREAKHLLGPTK